jgi:hypothetical protein
MFPRPSHALSDALYYHRMSTINSIDVDPSMLSDGRQSISQVSARLRRNQALEINLEWERDDTLTLGQRSQVRNQDGSQRVKSDLFCSSPLDSIFIFGDQIWLTLRGPIALPSAPSSLSEAI